MPQKVIMSEIDGVKVAARTKFNSSSELIVFMLEIHASEYIMIFLI